MLNQDQSIICLSVYIIQIVAVYLPTNLFGIHYIYTITAEYNINKKKHSIVPNESVQPSAPNR